MPLRRPQDRAETGHPQHRRDKHAQSHRKITSSSARRDTTDIRPTNAATEIQPATPRATPIESATHAPRREDSIAHTRTKTLHLNRELGTITNHEPATPLVPRPFLPSLEPVSQTLHSALRSPSHQNLWDTKVGVLGVADEAFRPHFEHYKTFPQCIIDDVPSHQAGEAENTREKVEKAEHVKTVREKQKGRKVGKRKKVDKEQEPQSENSKKRTKCKQLNK